jgi:hypothetical protein
MKDGVCQIIGKTIRAVITAEGNSEPPRDQVYLIFDDDTYYEFYGGDIAGTGGVDQGGSEYVLGYLEANAPRKGTVTSYFVGQSPRLN